MSGHKKNSDHLKVDLSWTLFLDRDGVINRKIDGDYVRDPSQFHFLPGVEEALVALSKMFGRIIIVSNQQGVGKGLMTKKDVEAIHSHIIKTIAEKGGRIDKIYYAPQLKEENSPMRKPGIGMAIEAKKDFPEIDFSKSIMVGDSMSDMEFGKKASMMTVFISKEPPLLVDGNLIDTVAYDLSEFVNQFA